MNVNTDEHQVASRPIPCGSAGMERNRLFETLVESWHRVECRWKLVSGRGDTTEDQLHRELGLVLASLPGGVSALDDLSRELEACFLSIGSALEKLPEASETLVTRSERLLALASGDLTGTQTFSNVIQFLEAPLAFVEASQNTVRSLAARLARTVQQIDGLTGAEGRLRRAVAPLIYIQTNFRIEAAPLSHEVQQMFLALTDDIERLHQQVGQAFGEKFAALRAVRATIVSAQRQLEGYQVSQGRQLLEKRAEVRSALTQLGAQLESKVERNIRLTDNTRLIQGEVGKLVVSLQTQDIVSQRLAHIREAVAGLKAATPAADSADVLTLTAATARLQAAQLESVGAELVSAHASVDGSVQRILEHLKAIDDRCLCLGDCDSLIVSAGGLIERLIESMEVVRSMVRKTVGNAVGAFDAVHSVGGRASNLTVVMRELSAQIQIIALNAQVQAAHNCGGTGLEVLAANTAMIANETGEISERVASGVDVLTADLDNLVGEFGRLRDEAAGWQATMDREIPIREQALHDIRDKTLNELMSVTDAMQAVTALARGMIEANALNTVAGPRIDDLRQLLARGADAAVAVLESNGGKADFAPFNAQLSKRYSVASEHEVHRRVFGITSAPVAASSVDDLLFGDDTPAASDGRDSAGVPDEASPGPVQGVPADQAAAATGNETQKPVALGENVELF